MRIYIAASWKHVHAVTMLTTLLRNDGHEVASWVENNHGEGQAVEAAGGFDAWCASDRGERAFLFDVEGAMFSDCVIYIGPSGCDAWAEVGAAFGRGGVRILALHAKGEQVGLMRRMVDVWCDNVRHLMDTVAVVADDVLRRGMRAREGTRS